MSGPVAARNHVKGRSKGVAVSQDDADQVSSNAGDSSHASSASRRSTSRAKADNHNPQQLNILMTEVRTLQRGFREMASAIKAIRQRLDGFQESVSSCKAEDAKLSLRQEEHLKLTQNHEERQAALEVALEQHRVRTEAALAKLASNTISHKSLGGAPAQVSTFTEQRLNDMSVDLAGHTNRIIKLEKSTTAYMQVKDRDRIASAVSDLQDKGAELGALFGQQRAEMKELQGHIADLQTRLSLQLLPEEEESIESKAGMEAVETQLKELVSELRKLQHEQT